MNKKKANSKGIKQAVDNIKEKTAVWIKVLFPSDTNINEFIDSVLFKIYIKSFLLKKDLRLNQPMTITFLNQPRTFTISDTKLQEDDTEDTNGQFKINEETALEIANNVGDAVTDLICEIEAKLTITNKAEDDQLNDETKKLIKKLIEEKLSVKVNNEAPVELIGMEEELNKIKKILSVSMEESYVNLTKEKNTSAEFNFFYKGLTITGPNGAGKTKLIKYLENSYKDKIYFLHLLPHYEDMEQKKYIQCMFKFAILIRPVVIVIENIDKLYPKTEEESVNEASKVLDVLLHEIDAIGIKDKLFVISTAKAVDKINDELVKCGRLDCNVNLSPPNQNLRKCYLKYFADKFNHVLTEEDFDTLGSKSHGFLPGDLFKIFKDAVIGEQSGCQLTMSTIEESLKGIKPINLKEIIIDVPKVLWEDIGGNKDIILNIRQSIEWPLKNPEAFKRIGISPPNGTLLYGPPGCSKTLIAKALATESGLNFFAVKGPELFSKYVGDTEKAVRDIFKKAKISSPSIIFFDEIDSMAVQRGTDSAVSDKVLCQLLNEMDGIEGRERVVIFGATNRPDILDKAIIRPGRFDRLIYIPPPDAEARREIFRINTNKMKVANDVNIHDLSMITEGFSGADITKVCREAGMFALSENINAEHITKDSFLRAINLTKPSISHDMLEHFEIFNKKNEI